MWPNPGYRCYSAGIAVYLYVVSTLRLAAASSAGGIQTGKHVPETHLVHSNNPGSTRIFVFPSCWRPDREWNAERNCQRERYLFEILRLHFASTLSCHLSLFCFLPKIYKKYLPMKCKTWYNQRNCAGPLFPNSINMKGSGSIKVSKKKIFLIREKHSLGVFLFSKKVSWMRGK